MKITEDLIKYFAYWTKVKIKIHASEPVVRYFYERQIWWASIGANIGFEQNGKNEQYERPILVLKKFNEHVLWILPLTSKEKVGKYYFKTEYDGEKSYAILSQLRLISSKRLLRHLRTMSKPEFQEIRKQVRGFI